MKHALLALVAAASLASGCGELASDQNTASRPGARTCAEWAALSPSDQSEVAERLVDSGGPAGKWEPTNLAAQMTVACRMNPKRNPALIAAAIVLAKPQAPVYDPVTFERIK